MFYLTTHEHLTHGKITFSAGASNPTEGLVGVVVTFIALGLYPRFLETVVFDVPYHLKLKHCLAAGPAHGAAQVKNEKIRCNSNVRPSGATNPRPPGNRWRRPGGVPRATRGADFDTGAMPRHVLEKRGTWRAMPRPKFQEPCHATPRF